MAPPLPRDINTCVRFIQSCFLTYQPSLVSNKNLMSGLITHKRLTAIQQYITLCSESNVFHHDRVENQINQDSSMGKSEVEYLARNAMLKNLDNALSNHNPEAAWEAFTQSKTAHHLPLSSTLLSKLITVLSYSSDPQWLQKGYSLVRSVSKEKPELIKQETLVRVCLSLARAQMVIPASKILRLMLWRHNLPPMDTFSIIAMHMVKTQAGTCLASNLLVEICDHIANTGNKKKPVHAAASTTKPGTKTFNLILNACVRFDLILKAECLIELMAQMGVVADAESILMFASIYEMSGQRDLLKSFKVHVDKVSLSLACRYRLFYDKLLSLHFKFDDFDSASGLIADMYGCWDSRPSSKHDQPLRPSVVPLSCQHLQEVLHIQIMPERLEKDSILLDESFDKFVTVKNRRLVITHKGLGQIIIKYRKRERISELSKLVIDIQNALELEESSSSGGGGSSNICHDVIQACIHAGWLETAHDVIDDMEMAGVSVPFEVYMSLLSSYCREKMFREAKVLRQQMGRHHQVVGLVPDTALSDQNSVSNSEDESYYIGLAVTVAGDDEKSELAQYIASELKSEGQVKSSPPPAALYELNLTINFFCKAKMLEDAMKAFKKLLSLKIQPTPYTFAYLVQAYSSAGMHREVTILWGEMRRSSTVASGDLYDLLLSSFIRGGYFGRALEIIKLMEESGYPADKWVYKSVFLKYHKGLYRNLKAADADTEVKSQRLEHVTAFRKWVR